MRERQPEYPPEYDRDVEGEIAFEKTLDMLETLYGSRDVESLSRSFYTHTACGGWLKMEDHDLIMGSIVEGSDADCTSRKMPHPVSRKAFAENVKELEDEATEIWNAWNEN